MKRGAIIRSARHYLTDYTENYFTGEICNDRFKIAVRRFTTEINFRELYIPRYGLFGKSSTTLSITNPSGSTFRMTKSSGAEVNFSDILTTGDKVTVFGARFSSGNTGEFTLTAVSTDYIEFTNASGVVESVTLGADGYIVFSDLIVLNGVSDFEIPTDIEKLAQIRIYNSLSTYNPVESDIWDKTRGKKCKIEDDRLILYPAPATGSILEINYYKKHPEIVNDTQDLLLPEECEDALVSCLIYELAKIEQSIGVQEVAFLKGEYEEKKLTLARFLRTKRYVGQEVQMNNYSGGMFNL